MWERSRKISQKYGKAICDKVLKKSPQKYSDAMYGKDLEKNLPEKFGKAICVRDLSSGQAVFGVVARLKG